MIPSIVFTVGDATVGHDDLTISVHTEDGKRLGLVMGATDLAVLLELLSGLRGSDNNLVLWTELHDWPLDSDVLVSEILSRLHMHQIDERPAPDSVRALVERFVPLIRAE